MRDREIEKIKGGEPFKIKKQNYERVKRLSEESEREKERESEKEKERERERVKGKYKKWEKFKKEKNIYVERFRKIKERYSGLVF